MKEGILRSILVFGSETSDIDPRVLTWLNLLVALLCDWLLIQILVSDWSFSQTNITGQIASSNICIIWPSPCGWSANQKKKNHAHFIVVMSLLDLLRNSCQDFYQLENYRRTYEISMYDLQNMFWWSDPMILCPMLTFGKRQICRDVTWI